MTTLGDGPRVELTSRVLVAPAVLEELVAHARQEAPRECCGILIGEDGRIEHARRARNLSPSSTRYLVDPEDHFAAIRFARARGRAVVGFYHSHPASTPTPSETDIAEAAYPGSFYLIVQPGDATRAAVVRAFLLHESGNFLPLTLVPTA